VKERIGQLARSRSGQEVVLRGEKETRYESLVRVLTLLRGMDVKPTLAP
jgi:biopolymer transport protein ExbD